VSTPSLQEVRAFWDAHPCGSAISQRNDRRGYFAEIRQKRYSTESHIPIIARFEAFADKDVLEIGCGIGTDGVEFARHDARYVGVDLSPRSLALAREQFDLWGLHGELLVADAERIPFEGGGFDHVYSFGVIHHSPDPAAIVSEIHRVLRPGGTFCVMLYNRSSINYRVEIMLLRRLVRLLLYPRAAPRLLARALGLDREKLERHRSVMLESDDIDSARWLSINTDGPDCPLARVYSEEEAADLFREFVDVESSVWFFDQRHWPLLGRLVPARLRKALGRQWGWHRVVCGRKAAAAGA
jgi:SAM-dependent methyltransferase